MSISRASYHAGSVEPAAAANTFAALCRRFTAPMLVAAVLIGGYEAHLALESPGAIIRQDLIRAGSEAARLPWSTPKERVGQIVSRYFPPYLATVDAAGFPDYVRVTLHGLDREACRDAYQMAGRMQGQVVIALERRRDEACKDSTSLTWHIMP